MKTTPSQEEEEFIFLAVNIGGALICVAFVAIIAGLFLGLLTLDALDLQIIQRASVDPEEITYATKLLPIVQQRHRVLVTLLLLNAIAYETLPIFLDALMPSWVAILLSSTVVLLLGEIIPSGIFMGPQQLYLGYRLVPLMKVLLWLLHPLSAPLTALLDYLTFDESGESPYNRGELSALVQIQHEQQLRKRGGRLGRVMNRSQKKDLGSWAAQKAEIVERAKEAYDDNKDNTDFDDEAPPTAEQLLPPLHKREVDLVEGALKMKTQVAMDVYTPHSRIYSVPDNLVLDKASITTIYGHGYSRVPVYHHSGKDDDDEEDPNQRLAVKGFLITRQLMLIDWDHQREIATLPLQRPICVSPRMNLVDLFENLQRNAPLMTFVCVRPDLANKALAGGKPIPLEAGFMGIVTLEDIMESILQHRIYDEEDIKDRDRAVATLNKWAATTLQSFMRQSANRKKQEKAGLPSGGEAGAGPAVALTSQPGDSSGRNERTPLLRVDGKSEKKPQYSKVV